MKYLLLILIGSGAYYFYANNYVVPPDSKALTYNELIAKVETVEVKASEILLVSHKVAIAGCKNEEWLNIRGVSSQQCMLKLNALKDVCSDRIFPEMDKTYIGKGVASKLFDRYSVCTGV